MTLSVLRRIVAVCILGSIAGMIVFSIRENIGGAMTAGVIGSIAVLCLITGTAIVLGTNGGGAQVALTAELDARVSELVLAGADEVSARSIVRKAVRLGEGAAAQRFGSTTPPPSSEH
jgi:hypothetical protein